MPSHHEPTSSSPHNGVPLYTVVEGGCDTEGRSWSLFKGHRNHQRQGNEDPSSSKSWFDSMFPFHDRGRRGSSTSLFTIGEENTKKKRSKHQDTMHISSPLSKERTINGASMLSAPAFPGYGNGRFSSSTPSLHRAPSPNPSFIKSLPHSPSDVWELDPPETQKHRRPSIHTSSDNTHMTSSIGRGEDGPPSSPSICISTHHASNPYPKQRTPALRLQIQVGDAFVPYMESHQEHGPEHQQRQEHAFLPPLNPALDIGTFSSGNPSPVLKNAVQISHLPPYFPEDDFGRNSGRNEKYAMTRLVALREHQQTLGYLLHRLPICAQSLVKATPLLHPNLAKDQEFTIRITPEAPESYSPHDDVGPDMSSDEQIRLMVQPPTTSLSSTLSTDPRESYPQGGSNLLQEYRTALMELWQVDQNLCHYLSRYIRTTRKNRRCLEFILGTTELLPKTTPVQGSKANVQQGSTRRMMTPVTPTLGPVHVSSFARHGAEQKHALHASATTTPTTSPSLVPYPSPKAINSPRAQASSQLNGAENTGTLQEQMSPSWVQASASRSQDPHPLSDNHRPRRQTHAPVLSQLDLFPPTPEVPFQQQQQHPMEETAERVVRRPVRKSSMPFARVVLDDEQIHTFSRHYDQVSSTELISPATPGFSPYGNNMAGSGPVGERPFKDYDEIEAAVLVGHHLACLQKANKLTEMFNEESRRSQGILERFEDARDAYESAIYGEQ